MSFQTIVTGKILNLNNTPAINVPVQLYSFSSVDVRTGIRYTSPYQTAINTDTNGVVQFSGVDAGVYDVYVSGSSYQMQNYQVKNSYVVVPGGSEFIEENRSFVRSSETLSPSGIMADATPRPNNQLGYPDNSYPESYYNVGTVSGNFVNRLDDSHFTAVDVIQRNNSDVYYRGDQNVMLSQKFTFRLPR